MLRFAVVIVLVAATAHADKSFNGGHGGSWIADPIRWS